MRICLLLRGINIGPHNRIAMPELREKLQLHGFDDVQTYLQSGNVVVSTEKFPEQSAERCESLIAKHFGFEIDVVARTQAELVEIIRKNPLGEIASNPKLYQVTFLSKELEPSKIEALRAATHPPEALEIIDKEIYAWHPDGVARSRLANLLSGRTLKVKATARNWTTVTKLLELCSTD